HAVGSLVVAAPLAPADALLAAPPPPPRPPAAAHPPRPRPPPRPGAHQAACRPAPEPMEPPVARRRCFRRPAYRSPSRPRTRGHPGSPGSDRRSSEVGPVGVEAPGQLPRLAEREQVPARQLVEPAPHPLADNPPLELERAEARG